MIRAEKNLGPRSAVILAAGFGSRIQNGDKKGLSKPLIMMGGLRLIERALHNLNFAGIKKTRIVVGAYKEELISEIKKLKSLSAFDIEFVDCPDFEKGNGASLAAGSKGLTESFLLVMADHVMSPDLMPHFIKNVVKTDPTLLYLATDPDVANCFDLDDATKILVEDSKILKIGKNLAEFNQIDTGLFYFPSGSAEAIQESYLMGAHSVSEIVGSIREKFSFRAQTISHLSFWQDVDTPYMAKEAEKRLLNSLVSQEDGWISRYLNRPISLRLSLILSRMRWHPNLITTIILVISLFSAFLAAQGDTWSVALAGILFQVASILDGCDGEVARMTFKQTRWGAWYDSFTHQIRYGAFFVGLGWGLSHREVASLYLLGAFVFVLFLIHLVIRILRFELHFVGEKNSKAVAQELLSWGSKTQSTLGAWAIQLRNLAKQDFVAFLAMVFCLLGGAGIFFWLVCVGLVLVTVIVEHVLGKKDAHWARGAFHSLFGSEVSFLFFAGGAALMLWIYGLFPMSAAFAKYIVYPEQLFALGIIPLVWFSLNSYAVSRVIKRSASFWNLFKSQIVGEAMNALVPVSGMMVEPVKARYYSRWVPLKESDRVVFEDRVLHVSAGLSFASILGICIAMLSPLALYFKIPLFWASTLLGAFALYMMRMFFDPSASGKAMGLLVQIGILDEPKQFSFYTKKEIFKAWFAKTLGRCMTLVEIAVLFWIMGIDANLYSVSLVMVSISFASIFAFWIPQGLGVHEVAVIAVFKLLGLPLEAAVVMCALRRLRSLTFSALGVTLLIKEFSFRKVKNSIEEYT